MELLERDGPLAALAEARDGASKGHGSVVLVTGEPGIGKTALVTRFVETLGGEARVLWGACDDLSVPRPLGPFRDLVGSASASLQEALSSEAPPHRIHSLLLEELEGLPRPTILVVEDIHWSDQATLDAITVIGRRIGGLPAVLVLTFRAGEVEVDHPLHTALGALRSDTSLYLQLAPLSRQAVAVLAGEDADRVYVATGGNPFYVTEIVAEGTTALPPSVANAVLGRAARLSKDARRLVELVSLVPSRMSSDLLTIVMPDWPKATEEPERRQLLSVSSNSVQFRHELARAAVKSSVPTARRRQLHSAILQALLTMDADPADIVHHAEEAGDVGVVADHVLIAARRAAAVESNREAYSHFRRSVEFADRLSLVDQAALFEDFASAAYLVGRMDDAFAAIRRAIRTNEELGDQEAIGRGTRILSRFHWYAGEGEAALEEGRAAVDILEPLGESVELAKAFSGLSQLAMLATHTEQAIAWGSRAVELSRRFGDDRTRAHALINIGSARMFLDPDDTVDLLEGHSLADASGDREQATRALLNLGYANITWIRPGPARRFTDEAIAYARNYEVDGLLAYCMTMSAWLHLRAGNWEEAERIAKGEVDKGTTVSQLLAKTVLAELAVRRGDTDAPRQLADLGEQADRTGELQRIGPVLALETEWALTTGAPVPWERFARAKATLEAIAGSVGWSGAGLAAWAAVVGIQLEVDERMPDPYVAMTKRDWAVAADAFGAVGWTYDRALMLSLLDNEQSLVEAIDIARRLGARPLEARLIGRLRELGMTVPRRPRQTTLANPAGLTSRQLEVLELLSQGLTNAEIAERLFVSLRTAEHHVEAILTKLGVSSRRQAALRYVELGLG
jgi:DNA-binding CsgD family transcriptional regulator/tetratricopeptide (TPR) repeat protein